jgi:hypothetical protein
MEGGEVMFKRETKYLVLKWEDINKYLTDEEYGTLSNYLDKISAGRVLLGKKENSYVVVNEDEPYTNIVWGLIELGEFLKR